ncbi:unnamed protein product, partial [Prorocentrum cordatum]
RTARSLRSLGGALTPLRASPPPAEARSRTAWPGTRAGGGEGSGPRLGQRPPASQARPKTAAGTPRAVPQGGQRARLVCRRDPGPREGGGRRAEAPDRHGPPQRRGRRRGARAVAGERAGPGAAVPAAARRAVGRSRRRRRAGAGRARRRRAGRPGAGAGAGLPGGWGAAAGRREGGQGFRRGDWQAWLSRVLPPFRPLGRGWPACARLRSRTATAGMVRKVA